jgi:hypothetical protein
MTRVVHCKKEKYDVYIGRPSKWGNPFEKGKDGTRAEVVKKYGEWILTQPDLLKDLHTLRNKTLGCWCYPKLCHGDVLKELSSEKYLYWETIKGDKYFGKIIDIDNGTAIVKCSDKVYRSVRL